MLAALVASALLWTAAGADMATTEYALSRGYSEANPMLQNRPARIALKLGITLAVDRGSHELEKQGHRRAARIVRWTVVGLWFGSAAWNIRQVRKR